ncbi:hypothetical protein AAFF_G00237270 [Aldrovandia affinis]|uniref:Uncharacterized protein n=1 Tax=Aldrovandia affinis TaxID=143900 RepID=A0AAD7RET9_9TELE|nr:hypothetical protein AAFF_G00237270 [Aldrovandia affinis]
MGLKGSKSSSTEAHAFRMGLDTAGKSNLFYKLKKALFSIRSVEYVEVEGRADARQHETRKKRKRHWTHCGGCDASGLVYVMDDPTGGVWMKPKESSARFWKKNP